MGKFSDMKSDGLEQAEDRLGGYTVFDTEIYESTVKLAYAGQSAAGARNITLIVDADGREYRETVYYTNRQGENFYLNKNDNTKKVPLPGYNVINDLCIVTTEKPLSEQETEEKVVNIYDNDAKKEVPKSVDVLTDLIGKPVYLGIQNSLENKQEKDGSGNYVPIADTRNNNSIDKIFHHPSKMTVVEATNGATKPKFFDSWQKKNAGQVRDNRKIKDGAADSSGRPSSGPPAGGSDTPRKSLFGK